MEFEEKLKNAFRDEIRIKLLREKIEREMRANKAPRAFRLVPAISDIPFVLLVLFWFFFAPYFAAALAKGKGRSRVGWTLLALLFGPVVWLVAALPRKQKT